MLGCLAISSAETVETEEDNNLESLKITKVRLNNNLTQAFSRLH
jgi:hypothetical protein